MTNTILDGAQNLMPAELLSGAGNRFEGRIRSAQELSGANRKDELLKVSQDFEAVFITYMLKVMRETIQESGLTEGGPGKSIYTDLFDQEIAQTLAQRGMLGISNLLYRNLEDSVHEKNSHNNDPTPDVKMKDPVAQPSPLKENVENIREVKAEITEMQLPVNAPVSSGFGSGPDPFTLKNKFHKGLDLAAPEGMKVVPALPGKVIDAGYKKEYGNYVYVQHSEDLRTRYGQLGAIRVKTGDTVTSEEILGTVGNTGHSTGPHLHFEVIRNGMPVDPLPAGQSQLEVSR